MSHRILILDDDADFNGLLTDIFSQADYTVVSEKDPRQALITIEANPVDLIVTDQQMPGMSGEEFMRQIKAKQPHVPVIMVSGYLDNDTIRDLIREGVGGIFLKPLNVFSLLKRTAKLLDEAEQNRGADVADDRDNAGDTTLASDDYQSGLPFQFFSFSCRDQNSLAFANKLYSLRNFKSSLSLVGPKGSQFREICQDIEGFEPDDSGSFAFVDAPHVTEENLLEMMTSTAKASKQRVTLVLLNADQLNTGQQEIIFKASKKEPPFAMVDKPVRTIFCLSQSIDDLFMEGKVNDNLYILMSTSEVIIPALNDCRDDIPVLAQMCLQKAARDLGRSGGTRLTQSALQYLRGREWNGNYEELNLCVADALAHSIDTEVGMDAFQMVGTDSNSGLNRGLREILLDARNDYCKAAWLLCEGNLEEASQAIGVDEKSLKHYLRSLESAKTNQD